MLNNNDNPFNDYPRASTGMIVDLSRNYTGYYRTAVQAESVKWKPTEIPRLWQCNSCKWYNFGEDWKCRNCKGDKDA